MLRNNRQKVLDFLTFPIRAVTLFEDDKYGLSSLRSERFDYVCREVSGYCLDIGCGRHNTFIKKYLKNNGLGIDVYPYKGLKKENIVKDLSKLPFKSNNFDTITFIANVNHIPRKMRKAELKEAFRCLKPNGKIIVTMGNPIAEVLVHKLVYLYDKLFKTSFDVDTERGMEDEDYYLKDIEITNLLTRAGFNKIEKKYFATQWYLNHQFIAHKS